MNKSFVKVQVNFSVLYRGGVSPWDCFATLCTDKPLAEQAIAAAKYELAQRRKHFGAEAELEFVAVLSVFWCDDGWWKASHATDDDGAGLSWEAK